MTTGNGEQTETARQTGHVLGEPIIITDDVKKWFGDFQALKGITTSVKEREVVVIIGPSGSGKSTFIRCLNRLEA
ncbi:MAG: ATP-binding cassette domain-containing protein, partial [Actinobacteria bacterium]|nr:ATP-binding cassette domain-containing protein [Actinomycetota bacterium]